MCHMATEAKNYANCRNTPNSDATPNKPPIWPNLSTNYDLIMQNKPNFPDDQMNVNKVLTKDYGNISNCKLGENKANSNPIQTQSKPIKANFTSAPQQYRRTYATAQREKQKPAKNTKASNGTKLKESGKPESSSINEKYTSAPSTLKSTPQKRSLHRQRTYSLYRAISTKIVCFRSKVPAKKRRKRLYCVQKRHKSGRTKAKLNLLRSLKMPWNLFERIINALRPGSKSEQPSDTSEAWPPELETDDTSETWPEGHSEQPEASEEPSPDFQESVNPGQPNQAQD